MLFEKGIGIMEKTTNAPNAPFDFNQKFESLEAAQAAAQAADLANFRITKVMEGEWLIIDAKGKPEAKAKADPAKGKAKAKPEAKPAGKRGLEARQAKQKADADKAKAKGKPEAKPEHKQSFDGPWHKLSDRKWIGKWAEFEASAKLGKLPDAMGAKAERAQLFGGIFAAETHRPFEKRILALAALIRAKDEKGLKALLVKEISTTPIMLGKLRDLAIAALQAKAEKPAKGNGKAKAEAKPEPKADEAPQA
jgi:hypothetical protein